MAGGMDPGTPTKGRRPLDTTINLVPFIDLMAVTIVFLIMTAVWTQLGRLQASQEGTAPAPDTTAPTLPPVALALTEKELTLSVGGAPLAPIAVTRDARGRLDLAALAQKLVDVKRELPEQNAITVRSDDGVRYEDLVRVIDACIGGQFPSVSVSPSS
jgi:biopolymer transport protein ExbD